MAHGPTQPHSLNTLQARVIGMMSYPATTSWVVLSAPPAPEPLFPILLSTIQDGGHLVAFVQNITTASSFLYEKSVTGC